MLESSEHREHTELSTSRDLNSPNKILWVKYTHSNYSRQGAHEVALVRGHQSGYLSGTFTAVFPSRIAILTKTNLSALKSKVSDSLSVYFEMKTR